ncbi:MAG: YceI family protein [Ekhidna sp.]|nr:YceI family protein [Ekhidna sp.]
MKKFILILFCFYSLSCLGQRYKTDSSYIRFFSSAPMEDIEAINNSATSIVDIETDAMVIVIPINAFQFEKKLMQEHFNENYLESEKYPKATFKGKIVEWSKNKGVSKAKAEGTLELHGVEKEVSIEGEIDYTDDVIKISTVFSIKLEDYKIKIPKAVFYKIAEEVEVTAKLEYKTYEKD